MIDSTHADLSINRWIAHGALPFAIDSPGTFTAAVDHLIAALGDAVELLGFGEALHGGEEILLLRNRLFQHLVAAHGFSAIAIESSFPKARLVDEYIAGCGPTSYAAIQDAGFGHAFGVLDANRELVEWMRQVNADPSTGVKLRFYGFDIPGGTIGIASPRHVLLFVLDYFAALKPATGQQHLARIEALIGDDAEWENPAGMLDPARAYGGTPAASALRVATEDLISDLRSQAPELIGRSDAARYAEALHYAAMARQLLNFHAAMARPNHAERLGVRDVLMADNLAYIMARERGRGKVLAFAHNSHLKRGMADWQIGPDLHRWWPAGAHIAQRFGSKYAVIGSAIGVSDENGIGQPEAGTLEALLTAGPGPARLIPTRHDQALPAATLAALPIRSGSAKNPTYFPLTPQSFTDFDWLAVVDRVTYNRGGLPLQTWDAG